MKFCPYVQTGGTAFFANWRVRLFASFFAGLILGLCLFLYKPNNIVSLMCAAPMERVSIVGLACVLFLPLLLSIAAVYFSAYRFLLSIVFLKAFIFCYCACSVVSTFGDAGWLMRWLMMFSDSVMLLPLLWFWYRNMKGKSKAFKREIICCCFFAAAIGAFDFTILSPFLVTLFTPQ